MGRKKQSKSIIKSSTLQRIVALLMIVFALISIFASCEEQPEASEPESIQINEEKDANWIPPPDLSIVEIPTNDPPRQSEEQTETEKETNKTTIITTRYVASKKSNKYHRTSCHYVDNILPENIVYYSSKDAAKKAGKSPCSVCSP